MLKSDGRNFPSIAVAFILQGPTATFFRSDIPLEAGDQIYRHVPEGRDRYVVVKDRARSFRRNRSVHTARISFKISSNLKPSIS